MRHIASCPFFAAIISAVVWYLLLSRSCATTALMMACQAGLPDLVRILLGTDDERVGDASESNERKGSAVDIQDAEGATALCYAVGWDLEAFSSGPVADARGHSSP